MNRSKEGTASLSRKLLGAVAADTAICGLLTFLASIKVANAALCWGEPFPVGGMIGMFIMLSISFFLPCMLVGLLLFVGEQKAAAQEEEDPEIF